MSKANSNLSFAKHGLILIKLLLRPLEGKLVNNEHDKHCLKDYLDDKQVTDKQLTSLDRIKLIFLVINGGIKFG